MQSKESPSCLKSYYIYFASERSFLLWQTDKDTSLVRVNQHDSSEASKAILIYIT